MSFHSLYDLGVPPFPHGWMSQDVSRDVWLERGHLLAMWRLEGYDKNMIALGGMASPDGRVLINPRTFHRTIGLGRASGLYPIRWSMERNMLRLVEQRGPKDEIYQLTLPPDCLPATKPDLTEIHPIEYPPTPLCFCSSAYVRNLGCESCRKSVLAIIRSFYGLYWPDFESAILRRSSRGEPAIFDLGKVPLQERPTTIHAVGSIIHLCDSHSTTVLNWLVLEAKSRIVAPDEYASPQTSIPESSRSFRWESQRIRFKEEGRCEECGEMQGLNANFCSKCGNRV